MANKFCLPYVLRRKVKTILHETHSGQSGIKFLTDVYEETDLDFWGPLDSEWSPCKNILHCIDRSSEFPSAKITSSTSAKTVINFLTDYVLLHGNQNTISVDYASCFTGIFLKLFCDSKITNNIFVQ